MEVDKYERRGINERVAQVVSISGGGGCGMKTTISTLHKNDKFLFNDKVYLVTKRYRNDNSPLKAIYNLDEELFYNEDLEIDKI